MTPNFVYCPRSGSRVFSLGPTVRAIRWDNGSHHIFASIPWLGIEAAHPGKWCRGGLVRLAADLCDLGLVEAGIDSQGQVSILPLETAVSTVLTAVEELFPRHSPEREVCEEAIARYRWNLYLAGDPGLVALGAQDGRVVPVLNDELLRAQERPEVAFWSYLLEDRYDRKIGDYVPKKIIFLHSVSQETLCSLPVPSDWGVAETHNLGEKKEQACS